MQLVWTLNVLIEYDFFIATSNFFPVEGSSYSQGL